MMRWTGLTPWDIEFPFLGSLTSTFLAGVKPPEWKERSAAILRTVKDLEQKGYTFEGASTVIYTLESMDYPIPGHSRRSCEDRCAAGLPLADMSSARKVASLMTGVIRFHLIQLMTDLLITQPSQGRSHPSGKSGALRSSGQ